MNSGKPSTRPRETHSGPRAYCGGSGLDVTAVLAGVALVGAAAGGVVAAAAGGIGSTARLVASIIAVTPESSARGAASCAPMVRTTAGTSP